MNFDGNFRFLGRLDVSAIKERVLAETDAEWQRDDYRQRSFEVHRATETLFLLFDRDFRATNPRKAERFASFADVLPPVFERIETGYRRLGLGEGYVLRALLVRLPPGGEIPLHIDAIASLADSHRVHVPILTNEAATFRVGSELRRLREGEVWEINNQRPHGVRNEGGTPRVHLLCDWLPRSAA
jgi:hypothetical protein